MAWSRRNSPRDYHGLATQVDHLIGARIARWVCGHGNTVPRSCDIHSRESRRGTVSRSISAVHAIQKDVFTGGAPGATRTRDLLLRRHSGPSAVQTSNNARHQRAKQPQAVAVQAILLGPGARVPSRSLARPRLPVGPRAYAWARLRSDGSDQ